MFHVDEATNPPTYDHDKRWYKVLNSPLHVVNVIMFWLRM